MERPRTTATHSPEPDMQLHAEVTIDTRLVIWKDDQLSLNHRTGKNVNTSRQTALWRGLGARASIRVPRIPAGHTARYVMLIRFPDGRHRDAVNYTPMVKALVDGAVQEAKVAVDDSWPHCVGQDARELRPPGKLEVILQIWTGALQIG
jgi:hypothetical protein